MTKKGCITTLMMKNLSSLANRIVELETRWHQQDDDVMER